MAAPPNFRDRVVRDLWWMATSPGLLAPARCTVMDGLDTLLASVSSSSEKKVTPASVVAALRAVDRDPGTLHAAVAPNLGAERFRLGTYFENLVAFFVAEILGFPVESGRVVRENKRTLGELDLLFRSPTGGHHWELAVKFFLHVPLLREEIGHCFVGPQTRDRLHRKIARLCDHQLCLPAHPAAARHLLAHQPLRSAAVMRGRLFYPAAGRWTEGEAGPDAARDHLRGWWCCIDRCAAELPEAVHYALLPRRLWLAPVDVGLDNLELWSREEVLSWCRDCVENWPVGAARSFQFAAFDAGGRELHRGFLCSVGWPGRGVDVDPD